ncbi:potassium channel family protein [Streptacidiphilus anmyonensis]|uniref:potassium channel family protein n=1 Tax=Streptacidiphilus anmyonensis TaxID=405782 RepID=UPI0005A846F3|nr:potassium channel family protein [Streptacidiphilus anmyonensis]
MSGATRAEHHKPAPTRLTPRQAFWAVLRAVGSIVALLALYYLLPLDRTSLPVAITVLLVGLAGFVALVVYQVEAIIRSPFPGVRAMESLATSVPFFLLLFASTYVVLAAVSLHNFGSHLNHTDSLYFTVTVFATVGFGDITAKSELARLVVTGQMIADLVVLGLAVRVTVGAVRRSQKRREPHRTAPEDEPHPGPPS